VREIHDRPSSDSPDDGRDAPGGRGRSQESGDWVVRDAAARTAYALEYRQRVESAYGQYCADHGLARPGNPAREADAGLRERCLGSVVFQVLSHRVMDRRQGTRLDRWQVSWHGPAATRRRHDDRSTGVRLDPLDRRHRECL
jgi:hypothetical protein